MAETDDTRALTTVLVVEDDVLTRTRYRRILRSAGFEVLAALNGVHALKLMKQRPLPDVIVLDLEVPGSGSLDLYDELRAQADGKPIPIVVVIYDELSPLEQARFPFFVHKPVVPEALVFAVDNALRRSIGTP